MTRGLSAIISKDVRHAVFERRGTAHSLVRSRGHLLRLEVSCLLSRNLILEVLDVLLRFGYVDRDSQETAAVAAHRFLRLSHGVLLLKRLQGFDLLQELIQRDECLRGQGLVKYLRIEMSSLDRHLNLLNENAQLLSRRLAGRRLLRLLLLGLPRLRHGVGHLVTHLTSVL